MSKQVSFQQMLENVLVWSSSDVVRKVVPEWGWRIGERVVAIWLCATILIIRHSTMLWPHRPQIVMGVHSWSRHPHMVSFNRCSSQLSYASSTPPCDIVYPEQWSDYKITFHADIAPVFPLLLLLFVIFLNFTFFLRESAALVWDGHQ